MLTAKGLQTVRHDLASEQQWHLQNLHEASYSYTELCILHVIVVFLVCDCGL